MRLIESIGSKFFYFIKNLTPKATISLDTDWFYRIGGQAFLWFAKKRVQTVDNAVGQIYRIGGLIPLKISALYVNLFDNRMVDRTVDGIAGSFIGIANRFRIAQRGELQENLTFALGGVVFITIMLLFFL